MFKHLLEYISQNFAFHYSARGTSTWIVCKEHGIFFTVPLFLESDNLIAMSEIGKHIDEKHQGGLLLAQFKKMALADEE